VPSATPWSHSPNERHPEPTIGARLLYQACGWIAIALGTIGLFLPLLPTVPFMLLAAFCFGRSNPALEARLLRDPRFGPHIRAWRERGAISRKGKAFAVLAFASSAVFGFVALDYPWSLAPAAVAAIGSAWIVTRPDG
jgi:uncharacterized membrane protein YbaN (DUF454 family)